MSYYSPVLAGTTLPDPSSYDRVDVARGAVIELANGSVQFELVTSGLKNEWRLGWDALTDGNVFAIETAYTAILTSVSANNFTDIDGAHYTATRHPEQKELKFSAVRVAGGFRWKAELRLREV